jgi:hypothetical protein
MKTNELQNQWFGRVHTEHLTNNEESVTIVFKTIGHIVNEEDLVNNPEFIEEGVVPGDLIEIHIESESSPALVVTPQPKKVRKTRVSKKK